MQPVPRLGRFESQVRMVLVLVVLFLVVLDILNLVLLGGARAALEEAERDRTKARAREAVLMLGADRLGAPRAGASDIGGWETTLRRVGRRFDFLRLALLEPGGAERAASSGLPVGASGYGTLDDDDRAALQAGRAVAGMLQPALGGESASISAFVPVLDASGKLVAIVEAHQPVPELGRLEMRLRTVVIVQIAGLVAIALVALLFARWVSRPYRQIVAAAGEAGLTRDRSPAGTGPADLAAAFRTVAAKLREQDEALGTLGREGGGLGDLVRFASGAASGMATGVLVVDRRGRIAAMNPAAELLLGVTARDAGGQDLAALARSVSGLDTLVRACLEQGQSASREVLAFRGDAGRTGHLGVALSPASGFGGEVAGALVLMTDLTEIRQIQEQARLRENLAAVGQLSAGIAHEVRNALGTILGWARMLEKRDDPRVHGPAREILKEVATVRAALDEFLLYARPPEPHRSVLDLESLVRSCVVAAPPGVQVEVAGTFGTVTGDEGLVRRVFGNLLQNAADAGGGDDVSVRISARTTGSGRAVQIDVDDDGPGIPAEKRDQVFVPFYTTRARGTGLGLALVQRTVVDMGGSVEALEGPRGGALFRIRLPLPAASTAASPGNPTREGEGEPRSV